MRSEEKDSIGEDTPGNTGGGVNTGQRYSNEGEAGRMRTEDAAHNMETPQTEERGSASQSVEGSASTPKKVQRGLLRRVSQAVLHKAERGLTRVVGTSSEHQEQEQPVDAEPEAPRRDLESAARVHSAPRWDSQLPVPPEQDERSRRVCQAGWIMILLVAIGFIIYFGERSLRAEEEASATLAPTLAPIPNTTANVTLAPTTPAPTTFVPTTLVPTTLAPTTLAPTTFAPTTLAPTTLAPTQGPNTTGIATLAPTQGEDIPTAPNTTGITSLAPTQAKDTPKDQNTTSVVTLAPTQAEDTPEDQNTTNVVKP